MAEDLTTPEGLINARLERDLEQAEKERDALRQLISRPITIAAADSPVMQEFKAHLPKISQISEHLATIAGGMVQDRTAASSQAASLDRRLDLLAENMGRIADVLERLAPVPADLGDDDEDQVTDRFVHVDNGNWATPPVWDGRVCKRYGMAWTVFDPGPNDPISAGGSCSLQHPGPKAR